MTRTLIVKLSPMEGLNSSMLRTLALCKGLQEMQHSIDFVTIPLSEVHTKNVKLLNIDLKNINIIKLNQNKLYDSLVKDSKTKSIRRFIVKYLRKIYHTFSIYNYTKAIAENIDINKLPYKEYDFIIGISDPKTSYIAIEKLISQGLKYKKYIQYWGDPLATDITLKTKIPTFYLKKEEEKFLKQADRIYYTSPFTLKRQQSIYFKQADKMRYVPTAYLEEKIFKPTNNEKYTLGYFGAYPSKIRNIQPLYDAIAVDEMYNLNIVGDSDETLTEKSNISIHPRGDISKFEEKTDLFICLLNNNGEQIPGKLYHYAAYNRPVLVILDGKIKYEMVEFLKKYHHYYWCENNSTEIRKSIAIIKSERRKLHPEVEFSYGSISKRILE